MTIADLTLLAAVLLTIGTIGVAKVAGGRAYNNANPRDPGFYQDPFRARALAAHQNGFEAFPFFAAAIILAEMRHAPQGILDVLAIAFILLRVVYVALYLGDKPTARSLVWFCAFACNGLIFFMPWWA
ncbi:MAG: MAPEG family protein [Proteobacteria bacterium]|nr:MAPEG family protein [Pseudomonadota bacterium]